MKRETLELALKTFELGTAYLAVKATPEPKGVPSAQAILDVALEATGHTAAWHASTLSGRDALDVLHAVRLEGCRWFREQAQAVLDSLGSKALFGDAKAKVGQFFAKARKQIKSLFLAGVLSIAGPKQDLGQEAVQELLSRQVATQHDYLADFEQEITSESRPIDGEFVARAESYGASVWGGTLNLERDLAPIARDPASGSAIFNFESRHHYGVDDSDLCSDCIWAINQGIVPIGTLPVIGQSKCRIRCHCAFSFYETIDGPEYTTIFAGRGPMDFGVFGVTGVDNNKSLSTVECVWDPITKTYVPCRDERGRFASCGGSGGQAKPKPGVKPAAGSGGGKKPRKPRAPKEPAKPKEPKKPKPAKEPKPPKTPKEPKEPKKPAEKKPPKESKPKPEKPAKEKPGKPAEKPEAKPPAAPGPGENWTVSPDRAKDWVKDSVFPVTLYHRTYAPAKADIESNGINLAKTSGVYGQGLYASTKQEKSFGPATVEVALDIRKPLIASRDEIHRLQREWGPPGLPLHSSGFRDEVVRRGYDSVITHFEPTYQGPSGENWVVIMKPETARFVQR